MQAEDQAKRGISDSGSFKTGQDASTEYKESFGNRSDTTRHAQAPDY